MKCYYVGNLFLRPNIAVTERESKKTGGKYFAVEVGEYGRGRELQFVPLHSSLVPQKEEDRLFVITEADLAVTKNGRYILVPAKTESNKALVQVYGEEGYRGSLEYTFTNNIEIIARGYYAQGEAVRMGGGEEYLLVMKPGDRIDIKRYGRLYGGNEKVVIEWDGSELRVYDPDDEPDFNLK